MLLIGLGGSVQAQYLAHNCRDMKIDAFEVSRDVVAAARNFFGLREAQESHGGSPAVSTVDAAEGLQQLASCDGPHLCLFQLHIRTDLFLTLRKTIF